MDFLFTPEAISSLLTLTFLEIILGIDNIVFISIVVGKLPVEKRKSATNIGLLLALVLRIILLFAISWLIAMQSTLFEISNSFMHVAVNGQSLILFAGGLFLLYKSTKEIHEKIDHAGEKSKSVANKAANTMSKILIQIILIDAVFSVDSILTAVGMTSGLDGAIWIMVIAVVVSILAMMVFAHPVTRFVHKHPSLANFSTFVSYLDWIYAYRRRGAPVTLRSSWHKCWRNSKRILIFCNCLFAISGVSQYAFSKE